MCNAKWQHYNERFICRRNISQNENGCNENFKNSSLTKHKTLIMKKFISLLLIMNSTLLCLAQSIGIGTNTPNNSAMLEISSTSRGMLIPRMTSDQRGAIVSPANGLLVYDVITSSFWYYNGSIWSNLIAGGGNSFTLPYSSTIALTTTAFKIKNDEYYNAIEGESTYGTGIAGKSAEGAGISGTSMIHNGVYGFSNTGTGVYASSAGGTGLLAHSGIGHGIQASSNSGSAIVASLNNTNAAIIAVNTTGPGVKSTSNSGVGIEGESTSGIGVKATSVSGAAMSAVSTTGYGIFANSTNNNSIHALSSNEQPTIYSSNTNGLGVAIKGTSNSHVGIYGVSNGVGANAAGVKGEAFGLGGIGIYGTSSSSQGYGIEGHNLTGTGVYGFSNTGTGVKALSNSGLALEVNGKLKIAGGNTTPSAGAVLTSDASGNAVWKNNQIAFSVKGINTNYLGIANDVSTKVHFAQEEYDFENDYALHVGSNPTSISSTFTVPVTGVYHFDASAEVNGEDYDFIKFYIRLMMNRNGTVTELVNNPGVCDNYYSGWTFAKNAQAMLSRDIRLLANDIVWIEVVQHNTGEVGEELTSSVTSSYFNGHLVIAK
jgi:hypothetical protein